MPNERLSRFAPRAVRYFVLTAVSSLPRARRLLFSTPLSADDGGDGGDYTVTVGGASGSQRGVLKLAGQLAGTADSPEVRGMRVTDGGAPQLLTFGDVADGDVLRRSGTSVVGASFVPSSGGSMTGDLAMSGHKMTGLATGSASGDAVTYGQVTALVNGLDWQQSVLDKRDGPPGSSSTGDRYLVGTGAGGWTGHANAIAQYDGSAWQFTAPNNGFTVHIESTGRDYNYNGSAWVDIGASIDHGALLNLTTGDPHTQYQTRNQLDQNSGYAGLDAGGLVNRPVKAVRTGGDPGSPISGEVWINGSVLKFRDASGSPQTQIIEGQANRDANSGYAGLDSNGLVNKPIKTIRTGGDPGSPVSGDVWVNGSVLKFRDASGSPQTQSIESQANRNQANGYAGLDATGRLSASQAPPKSVYATGGGQALIPADIGAASQGRNVSTGPGLAGGGDLSNDRTLSIASFSGLVAKDIDPASDSWSGGETKLHLTIDIGPDGHLVPVALRLPATVDAALRTEVVFEFDDASTLILTNADTANPLDKTMADLATALLGDVTGSGTNNGRRVRKILLRSRNSTGGAVSSVDIGAFRVRAWGFPRGAGSAL